MIPRMNSRRALLAVAVLAVGLCIVSGAAPAPRTVKRFKGRVVGFVVTDYVFAVICTGDSSELFGLSSSEAGRFVAAHPGTLLDLEVSEIGRDTLSSGNVEVEYGLTGASLNGYDSHAWWSDLESVLGYERARTLFQALEESLTVSAHDDEHLPPCPPSAKARTG
jgi:hypothetical protein